MIYFRFFGILFFALLCGCGGSPQPDTAPVVLVQVDDADDTAEDTQEDTVNGSSIMRRLESDARLAFDVVGRAIGGDDPELAALAAVYARRLGLKHDESSIATALKKGIRSEDPLLAALSWRWLLVTPSVTEVNSPQTDDPVVAMMQVLFELSRGNTPSGNGAQLLSCSNSKEHLRQISSEALARTKELWGQVRPFDNGALALSLALFESRRYDWIEKDKSGGVTHACHRIRHELFTTVKLPEDLIAQLPSQNLEQPPSKRSGVLPRLENPMVGSPIVSLRGAVLSGPTDVRISALRAMTVVVKHPELQDLGAAAADLASKDLSLQLEAARTLLYLIALTQKE